MSKKQLDVTDELQYDKKRIIFYNINKLKKIGLENISRLPSSIKILLEAVLRNFDNNIIKIEHIENLANWNPKKKIKEDFPFIPARVILQDFTGVPAVVDLAAMRSAYKRLGGNPASINPLVPVDLVIDHSVQVDYYGTQDARLKNEEIEFKRNKERYLLLRWAQKAFDNFKVVPPGRGIVHQVNLEYLASVIQIKEINEELVAFPDTLVGTDSHTTMINGLGVLGWGVGGIEAEAVMLGQPYYMPIPDVIGVRLIGELKEGVTATDLVLRVTQMLREYGVVGKFVEFFGSGLCNLSLPDRATISNMAPEYGATMGFFPIDEQTIKYLLLSGRKKEHVELIKNYAQRQGIFYEQDKEEPMYTDVLELDLLTIEPSLAGPKRPQDRIPMNQMEEAFDLALTEVFGKETAIHEISHEDEHERWQDEGGSSESDSFLETDSKYQQWLERKANISKSKLVDDKIKNGSVVIAAITSCTNTSNPSVLIGAGLLAKNAVEKGLIVKPFVKTSLAPGSRVVSGYLEKAKLLPFLEKLGFHIVGYGCTTCIGNSGPLDKKIVKIIQEEDLVVAAVLSGNRNFEGRINPYTKANYLASPMLVVAYALAGTIDINLTKDPIGNDKQGKPVFLKDIWPNKEEINKIISENVSSELFREQYSEIFEGTDLWMNLSIPKGKSYNWDMNSTYIQEPPFFIDFPIQSPKITNIKDARVLVLLGDSITTDHISPAGAIPAKDPAGTYLIEKGIKPLDFNSFGSRRGNHEVMLRGTFGNIRLRNKLAPEKEGGWTNYIPSNKIMSIYDAAMKYKDASIPLIVIAGKEYGTGSSRDWAAKGTLLLGVKAVLAESYERIHRSNLVGMGVLPLEFLKGEDMETLKLTGKEQFSITGIDNISPGKQLVVKTTDINGNKKEFKVLARLDSDIEVEYYRNGGILHTVLRNMVSK
ncbi:MAG: aconitate hydratase AcnA [Candidatus Heimdallarchaeota archaeon]|nr:aconitate hydratase AcnA [Candidatus Heimdallarchaeota archaeon]MCK4290346.1 aconitate hydratase AcnA [Candidatus Heimdallarchaeota archaeon]